VPEKKWIEIAQLAALIEDSLSACAGWTVPSPTIYLRTNGVARDNWYIELNGLDHSMVQAIASLQNRFNVKIPGDVPQKPQPMSTRLVML
jgi:hypothetical protein